MPKYIGATIGPIYNTISRAESTRELWSSSYLFSYIMREIIKELCKKGNKFVLPYTGDNYLEGGKGVGLFHDRFIMKVKSEKDFDDIIETKNIVLEKLEKEIERDLKEYISFYLIEKDLKENENIIFEISKYLNILELEPKLNQKFDYQEFYKYLGKIDNKFIKDAKIAEIKSLPEISMKDGYNLLSNSEKNIIDEIFKEHGKNDDVEAYNKLQESLKSHGTSLKKYNTYYALLKADGDGIGKIIEKIGKKNDENEYIDFSKSLFEFAKNTNDEKEDVYNIVKNYAGLSIYVGGDDILCFLPIKNGNEDIFEVIGKLSKLFYNSFKLENPTLSFGMTINYYKYPLSEALDKVDEMLYKAKNKGKNAIAINFEKHSGKPTEFILKKTEDKIPENVKRIFKIFIDIKYMNGVIKRIEKDYFLLNIIGKNEEKVKNYFENTFKDEKHKHEDGSKLREEIKLLKDLVIEFSKNKKLEDLYKLLKFVCFLNEVGGENA